MDFIKKNIGVLLAIFLLVLGYDILTIEFWVIVGSVVIIQLLFGWYD